MCFMLYLGSARPLPTIEDDARYPMLTVVSLLDHTSLDQTEASLLDNVVGAMPYLDPVRNVLGDRHFVYEVSPTGLCGCYFEHTDRAELEGELQHASAMDMRAWVSTVAYPDLEAKQGARRWWERKHTAVTSLGWYLRDHVPDGVLVLYGVWATGADDPLPALELQTITPAYFTQATSLALPDHMLFTIVPDPAA